MSVIFQLYLFSQVPVVSICPEGENLIELNTFVIDYVLP